MATVSENFDVRIKVVFPFLTKSLPKDDSERINATGTFNFEPPPQVDTAQGVVVEASPVRDVNRNDRVETLRNDLQSLLEDFNRIQEVMKRKAEHIVLAYDPELAQNEALTNAEAEIFGADEFGVPSGRITYEMYEQVVEYHEKINKYISHLSIENEGALDGIAV